MTSRQAYEAVLIELNKEQAPDLLLEDFNYLFNKAIYLYINKRYNIYDINQQTTDDLRVLKATALLDTYRAYNKYGGEGDLADTYPTDEAFGFLGATYEALLPNDYYHILNCVCIYKVNKTFKCYNKGDYWRRAATRLTADAYSQVLDNFYLRPTYRRPYYYIHNVNQNTENPTNPYNESWLGSTDIEENRIEEIEIEEGKKITSFRIIYTTSFNDVKDSQDGDASIDPSLLANTNNTDNYNIKHGDTNDDMTCDVGNYLYDETNKILYKAIKNPNPEGNETWEDRFEKISPAIKNKGRWIKYADADSHNNPILNTDSIDLFSAFKVNNINSSNIERAAEVRYGNASDVRIEIRYGSDDSLFTLTKIYVDYIKTPQNIRLTLVQLDRTEDTSQVLEFPDYVCQEIINELVHVIMENNSDLRLLTHPVVSLSIANPAQQLAPELAAQAAQ